MNWRHVLLGCLLFVVVTVSFSAGVAGDITANEADDRLGGHQTEQEPGEALAGLLQEDIDADTVLMRAQVEKSGDATWTLQYRLRLDTDEKRQAFDELEADIEANRSAYLDPFESRLTETVATAESATGREMSATDFTVSTQTDAQPQAEFGLVVFEFEWGGFAAVSDDEIHAGDALDRLFLEDGQRLQIDWPDSYEADTSTPVPAVSEQHRVVWHGPIEFAAGQPRVVLSPVDEGVSLLLPAGGGLAALALVGGVYWWHRRARPPSDQSPATANREDAAEADEPPEHGTPETAATAASPPPELLSNEERLLQLLQEHGGRMKQQAVADELDWSAAKTSQVVSDLRDADELDSFRLGRENILTLPDVDIVEDETE